MTIRRAAQSHSPLPGALAALLVLLGSGCTTDNPHYCNNNSDCVAAAGANEIPSANVYCLDHVCFAGCTRDIDCQGSGFRAGLTCNRQTRLCQFGPSSADAGPDGPGGPDAGRADSGTADLADAQGPDAGLPLGGDCGDPGACASRNCVNGVCCEQPSCGSCQACNVEGSLGQCANLPDDGVPDDECLNATSGCQGGCNGDGACAYDETQVCDQVCNDEGAGSVLEHTCTAEGNCSSEPHEEPAKQCAHSRCTRDDANRSADCPGNCATHEDCIDQSACDRTQLHSNPDRRGQCVDPTRITATAADDEALKKALAQLEKTTPEDPLPVILLKPTNGAYEEPHKIESGKRVLIIAAGNEEVGFDPAGNDKHAFEFENGGELQLQGVTVAGVLGSDFAAILCSVKASERASLTVVESTIETNQGQGISATNCDATVRRSIFRANERGALALSGGTFVITNTLIVGNGTTGISDLGGVDFGSGSAVTFINNTVAGNHAKSDLSGGVICKSGATRLRNSILAQNDTKNVSLCTVESSSVDETSITEACGLDGEWKPTKGVCLDGGDNTAAQNLSADLAGNPRRQGGRVDIGAYEVQ